jgi:hypothetical protein
MVELIDAGWNREIKQIKEKFGGLRFYIGTGDDKLWDIITEYEKMSYITCEECGKPGELRKDGGNYGGWWQTLCDKHYTEIKEIQKQNGRS